MLVNSLARYLGEQNPRPPRRRRRRTLLDDICAGAEWLERWGGYIALVVAIGLLLWALPHISEAADRALAACGVGR